MSVNSNRRLPEIRSRRATLLLAVTLLWATIPILNLSAAPRIENRVNLIPRITSIDVQGGQLIASGASVAMVDGKMQTVPFSTTLEISLAENQRGAVCPLLDLHLNPIALNLLGLVVQTSPICLNLIAVQGGGLLGDLLCGLGQRVAAGQPLGAILAGERFGSLPGFSRQQIQDLRGGLKNLLNEALSHLEDAVGTEITVRPPCDVLHLELGPINLNLLGLLVLLHDCEDAAVVVDITGEEGLLGNLLCNLLGHRVGVGVTLAELLQRTSSQ